MRKLWNQLPTGKGFMTTPRAIIGSTDVESKAELYSQWQEAAQNLKESGHKPAPAPELTAQKSMDDQWHTFMRSLSKSDFMYGYRFEEFQGDVNRAPTTNGEIIQRQNS